MTRFLRLWPLLVLALALFIAWRLGLIRALSFPGLARHQATLHVLVQRHPLAAPLVYVVLYALAIAFSVPGGAVLTAAGGLLFGTWLGGILAVAGASAGAVALFLIVRTVLRPLVLSYAGPLVERLRPGLERDGFSYLLVLRLVPVFPFWLVNLAPALVGMRLVPYALATMLGILPATFVFASIGAGLSLLLAAGRMPDASLLFSLRVIGPLLGLAVLALLPVLWRHRKGGGSARAG